jgi:hypothetical protein
MSASELSFQRLDIAFADLSVSCERKQNPHRPSI